MASRSELGGGRSRLRLDAVHQVAEALRLSAHVLLTDKNQLASQMLGRLDARKSRELTGLLRAAGTWSGPPWVRPVKATLTVPGGPLRRTLQGGHTNWISAVAVTPDGRLVLSVSGEDPVKVWDLERGRLLNSLPGASHWMFTLAVTPDGHRAIYGLDNKLRLSDLESGRELLELEDRGNWAIKAVAVTPDGSRVISASTNGTLKVWDLSGAREMSPLRGHNNTVNSIAITPDGARAISGSSDGTVKIWDLQDGHELRTLECHALSIEAVAVTPDSRRAVCAALDNVTVWELENGHQVQMLRTNHGFVRAVAVAPDGRRVILGSSDGTLEVWDSATGRRLHTLRGHTGWVNAVAVTPDGRHAVSGSSDQTLKVWDLDVAKTGFHSKRHRRPVRAIAITSDGRTTISGSEDRTLKVWNLSRWPKPRTLKGHHGSVNALAIIPDRRLVISGSSDKTLRWWNFASGKQLRFRKGHVAGVSAIVVTRDCRRVVSGSQDGTAKVWDLKSGRELHTLEEHRDGYHGQVCALAVTPRGYLATSWQYKADLLKHTKDASPTVKNLIVWDVEAGKKLRSLAEHAGRGSLAAMPDGYRVIAASRRFEQCELESGEAAIFAYYTLKTWDLKTGKDIGVAESPIMWGTSVNALAATPDGRLALSALGDTLTVWRIENGEELCGFTADAPILSVAVADDSRTVVIGDGSGVVHFLKLEGLEMRDLSRRSRIEWLPVGYSVALKEREKIVAPKLLPAAVPSPSGRLLRRVRMTENDPD